MDHICYIDFHTHNSDKGDYLKVVSLFLGDDEALANGHRFSAGIHPMHSGQELGDLEARFGRYGSSMVAIGEVGVDRSISVVVERQLSVLEQQLAVAQRLKLPVVVHAVRSYSDVLGMMKRYAGLTYIFHAFSANALTLSQLLRYDAYFSVGLRELERPGIISTLKQVPLSRLFLESDDSNNDIRDSYKRASEVLAVDEVVLAEALYNNYKRIIK